MKKYFPLVLFLLVCCLSHAQILGGFGVYKFMNIPSTSRTAALGGNTIMLKDEDVGLTIQNPALLNKSMSTTFSTSYIDYIKDINIGSLVGAYTYDKWATNFSAGVQYINYGTFDRTDVVGNKLGTFTAADYCYFLQASREWKNFSYGAATKFIYSQLESYYSYGWALDLGGTWQNTDKNVTASLVVRNIGQQLKIYKDMYEPLPFQINAGISYKPKHAPLRLSLGIHDMQRYDISYINTNKPAQKDLETGEEIVQKVSTAEKIGRHFSGGAEVLLTPGFQLQFGYNHQRRSEMTLPDNRGMVGFSGGVRIKVYKFFLSYGITSLHSAGISNTFSLSANINSFIQKPKAE